jgi:hypothetical protein
MTGSLVVYVSVVYVSGPLTGPALLANVHRAVEAAERLRRAGLVPVVPHLGALWAMIAPGASYEDWMRMDMAILERCDAVLRLPGESVGADREVTHARELGIPVFSDEAALLLTVTGGHADRRAVGSADSRVAGRGCRRSRQNADPKQVGGTGVTDGKSAICARQSVGPRPAVHRGMNTAPLVALKVDADDLSAALHLVGDGAGQRGDDDTHRALRLLARHAEAMGEAIERLLRTADADEEETRCQ